MTGRPVSLALRDRKEGRGEGAGQPQGAVPSVAAPCQGHARRVPPGSCKECPCGQVNTCATMCTRSLSASPRAGGKRAHAAQGGVACIQWEAAVAAKLETSL